MNVFFTTVPLQQMEELERKYNIHLHIEQYGDLNIPDKYYQILKPNIFVAENYVFLGNTIEEVEQNLKKKYGY